MKVIGLTGSWGTGKTAVAKMLQCLGAKVIDADKIAHQVIRPDNAVYQKVVSVFGRGIFKNNSRAIDRKKLGKIVFADKVSLGRLNKIVHPEIVKNIKGQLRKARAQIIVLDAPLLIEAGLDRIVDKLIVVKLNKEEQMSRLKDKTGLSRTRILKRILYQLPLSYKIKKADFVIDNNGTRNNTYKQVKAVWKKLR